MNDIKLIVTDLDGTLLNDFSDISSYNKKILRKLMDNGIEVVFATGRQFNSIYQYRKYIDNKNDSIVFNGAVVADNEGHFIYNEPLDYNDSYEIFNICSKYNVSIHIYRGDESFVLNHNFNKKLSKTRAELENDNLHFTKILIIGDRNILEKLQVDIRNNLNVHTSFSHINFLEILKHGVHKGSALNWLIKRKGIKKENVIAFGDNYNDIEMLKIAGIGVAMGNAEDAVKNIADEITLTNELDGVGKFLANYFRV